MKHNNLAPLTSALVAAVLLAGAAARAAPADDAQIRAVEDRFAAAISAKDVDAIMKVYAPGDQLLVFDVTPPRQYVGWDAYKKDWRDTLASFAGPITFKIADLKTESSGDLGYSHSIQTVTGADPKGAPMALTVRVTDVYRKIDGKWLIVHEHVSAPIDLATGKADLTSAP